MVCLVLITMQYDDAYSDSIIEIFFEEFWACRSDESPLYNPSQRPQNLIKLMRSSYTFALLCDIFM